MSPASLVSLQPLDAGSSGVSKARQIPYSDLRVASTERKSSESTRSTSFTTNRVEDLLAQFKVENQIKRGAENMLQVLEQQKGQHSKDPVQKEVVEARKNHVESQLDAANAKILLLKGQLLDFGVSSKFRFVGVTDY